MSINKILVTGSNGTIGTRLCEKLLDSGFEVCGVDKRKNPWNDKVNDITINLDLRYKKDVLNKLPKDIDLVIHLAANARVYNLVKDPSLARDNFETLFNVLEYVRLNNIPKIIFSSSREVYGNSNQVEHSEEDASIRGCESPYTASKVGGESLVYSYNQCYPIDFIVFRFSNVYGMYDDSDRVIPLFIENSKKGNDLVVYGKEKLLDFTYIDDCVKGIIKSIKKFDSVKNDNYNLAYGKGNSILSVAKHIKSLTNSNSNILLKENRTGEVVKYIADISKAKDKIGYSPEVSLLEGIKKTIEFYSKND